MIIICLSMMLSCHHKGESTPAPYSTPFSVAADYYSILHSQGWSEDLILEQNNKNYIDSIDYFGGFYYYKKLINDTIEFLSFVYYESLFDTIFIPKEYYQWFRKDLTQHVLLFGEKEDTLFYYKASLIGSQKKIFHKGMYNYQYKFNLLSDKQRLYYRNHQDSLSKIFGNNLAPLPEE